MPISSVVSGNSRRVVRRHHPFAALLGVRKFILLLLLGWSATAAAIPPDTPITNTAVAGWQADGVSYAVSASNTVVTDPASGNSPPSGVLLDPATVAENQVGVVIGQLTAVDLDPADTHTYSVSDPRFVVNGDELSLAPGESLDFEAGPQVTVDILVSDSSGVSASYPVVINVTNVNEAPTAIDLSSNTFDAGVDGAVVGDLSVVDPDIGDTHTYSVDDARFEVVGSTLKLLDDQSLPLGSVVDVLVTVTDAGGLSYQTTFSLTAVPPGSGGTGSGVALLQYAPASGADQNLNVAQCDAGAGYADLPDPVSFSGDTLAIPGPVPLGGTSMFKSGQPVFVRVDDPDADLDPLAIDHVLVEVSSAAGDAEQLRLAETALNSGQFAGYLPSGAIAAALPGNCVLESGLDLQFTVSYTDAFDPGDASVASAVVNPVSEVFYAVTGQPIDGAIITLLNTATGLPAAVGGEAPDTVFPATVESGGVASDNSGASYDFGPGEYRYPVLAAGSYQLQVTPPNRFRFPSTVSDQQMQLLPDGPFVLGAGSRGAVFTVTGPAFALDIPLDLAPIEPTPASLELLSLDADGSAGYVGASACYDGAAFVPSPAPVDGSGEPIVVPGDLPLSAANRFVRGDVMFLRVVDRDQDLDPFAADSLEVAVSIAGTEERERVLLIETGASTGEFSGYLQTALGAASANDCALQGAPGSAFSVDYLDPDDDTDVAAVSGLLEPPLRVFSSADGSPIDGAEITLIDAATNLPAVGATFSEDGVTPFPVTLTSGGIASDAAGNDFDFASGSFYWPVITPGNYRLQVLAPSAYQFPSTLSDEELNSLPNGPFSLTPGSRGEEFVVTADAAPDFDVPLDPQMLDIFVSKQASKTVVAVGDFLQYEVLVQNPDLTGGAAQLAIIDMLPAGFRYVNGSTKINGISAADPEIADDGRQLTFAQGQLAPAASLELRYVAQVTAGAELGRARNEAYVSGIGVGSSNVAFADVMVREDLFQSKAIIIGQVLADGCDQDNARGLGGVRVWLENGTYVVTDEDGRYHIEGVEPGSHVVQLDLDTLPVSHEVVQCEHNTRFAGSAFSQFVDVEAGALWRADFYTALKAPEQDTVRSQLRAEANNGQIDYQLVISGGEVPLRKLVALVMPEEGTSFIPGSLRIDGSAAPDPALSAGAISLRLGDQQGEFQRDIRFSVRVPVGMETVTAKSLLMFETTTAGKQKSPVMSTELQFNWPDSLTSTERPQAAAAADDQAPQQIVAGVFEPSRGQLSSSSELAQVAVSAPAPEAVAPYTLPEVDNAEAPDFSRVWLAGQTVGNQLLWPLADLNPRIPAITVAAKHELGLKASVQVNGKDISPLSFTSTVSDRKHGVAVSRWDNVAISEGNNIVEVLLVDQAGEEIARMRTAVHFGGSPVRAEFVPEVSYLIADGVTPPVVAVRMFDREGYPARPGLTGEFAMDGQFAVLDQSKALEVMDDKKSQGFERYLIRKDGIAFIQLEPTTVIGEAKLRFEFDQHRTETIRARLQPGARDWILVGLLEGTLGYNDVSGNLQTFRDNDLDDDTYTEGRTAFYAKGLVQGQWLLTAAYDTDKDTGDRLKEQIDPNRFYTLYGDGTEQRYDAQSNSKLYLKVEREAFSALWGDFDTGWDDTELTRFNRTLNGLQVNQYGEKWEIGGFASSTENAFIYDQIQGDGTSGVYQLSQQNLLINSEQIRIVTRDRFHSLEIVEEAALTRYLDYTIDYDEGTIVFKQPIPGQDFNLNPVYIEAEYEVKTDSSNDLVAGARIAYRLDDQDSRVGLTYLKDGTEGREGDLVGMDLRLDLPGGTSLYAEAATSDTDINGSAYAYLMEAQHQSENLAGRAYLREQETAFGLGQQAPTDGGTREFGVEGDYLLSEQMTLRAEMYRQEDLAGGGHRTVMESQALYQLGDAHVATGLRSISEETANGEVRDGNQATLGVNQSFLNNRLLLRGDAELELGDDENTDFPYRTIFGAEYVVSDKLTVVGEQEFTWGETRDTQDTRIGVKARPWVGGDISSLVQRELTENGERVFATTGLLQQWQFSDVWRFDFGADRVQTIKSEEAADNADDLLYNPNLPPASGSVNNDFTALFGGVGYRQAAWDASMRLEYHHGDQADKWNYLAGASKQLAEGKVTSGSLSARYEELQDGSQRNQVDLRWGIAWRPTGSTWMLLNRLDLIFDEQKNDSFDTRSRKLVDNFNANIKPAFGGQLSLQLGLKYVVDNIDGDEYDGVTALYGLEYRRNFNPRWDWGVQGSVLQTFNADVYQYSTGVSIGHSPFDNTWVSLGYNVAGFEDSDFTGADYTAQGPYLKFRMKLDQTHLEKFVGFVGQGRD